MPDTQTVSRNESLLQWLEMEPRPDGSLILEADNWRFFPQANTLSVVAVAQNQEILRVESGRVVIFVADNKQQQAIEDSLQRVEKWEIEQRRLEELASRPSRGLRR